MGNEVKRYDSSDELNMRACEDGDYVRASDYDALRSQMEAFRCVAIPVLRLHLDNASVHPCDEHNDRARANECSPQIRALYDALTATPAPEVRSQQFAKPTLLKDCNVSYSNSSQPLSQHAERQEAVAWRVSISGMWQYFNTQAEAQAEYDQCHVGDEDYAEYSPGPLYTSPPPAQDVRPLVEALEVSVDYLDSNTLNSIASGSTCHRKMRNALAAHRQAQRQA